MNKKSIVDFSVFTEQELVDYLDLNGIKSTGNLIREGSSLEFSKKIIRKAERLFYDGSELTIPIINYLERVKIEDLPKDMFLYITQFLRYEEVINLCSASESYRDICNNRRFWMDFIRLREPSLPLSELSTDQITLIAESITHYDKLKFLENVKSIYQDEDILKEMFEKYKDDRKTSLYTYRYSEEYNSSTSSSSESSEEFDFFPSPENISSEIKGEIKSQRKITLTFLFGEYELDLVNEIKDIKPKTATDEELKLYFRYHKSDYLKPRNRFDRKKLENKSKNPETLIRYIQNGWIPGNIYIKFLIEEGYEDYISDEMKFYEIKPPIQIILEMKNYENILYFYKDIEHKSNKRQIIGHLEKLGYFIDSKSVLDFKDEDFFINKFFITDEKRDNLIELGFLPNSKQIKKLIDLDLLYYVDYFIKEGISIEFENIFVKSPEMIDLLLFYNYEGTFNESIDNSFKFTDLVVLDKLINLGYKYSYFKHVNIRIFKLIFDNNRYIESTEKLMELFMKDRDKNKIDYVVPKIKITEKIFNILMDNRKIRYKPYHLLGYLTQFYPYEGNMETIFDLELNKDKHIKLVSDMINNGTKIYKDDLRFNYREKYYLIDIAFTAAESVDPFLIPILYKNNFLDTLKLSLNKLDFTDYDPNMKSLNIETLNIAIRVKEYNAVEILLDYVEPDKNSYYLADDTILEIFENYLEIKK